MMRLPRRKRAEADDRFLPLDDLGRRIHQAIRYLEPTGQFEKASSGTSPASFNGFCARAADAYRWLVENEPAAAQLADHGELKLRGLKRAGSAYGESHYWLVDAEGRILDLVVADGERPDPSYPYDKGKGMPLRRDKQDARLPSRKDTQRLIAAVRASIVDRPLDPLPAAADPEPGSKG